MGKLDFCTSPECPWANLFHSANFEIKRAENIFRGKNPLHAKKRTGPPPKRTVLNLYEQAKLLFRYLMSDSRRAKRRVQDHPAHFGGIAARASRFHERISGLQAFAELRLTA